MADETRIYGAPESGSERPPAKQGVRGENRAEPSTDYAHDVSLADGRTVTVTEDSGVAFAEATGRAGRREEPDELEIAFTPDPGRERGWPLLFFGLIGIAGGLYWTERRRRGRSGAGPATELA